MPNDHSSATEAQVPRNVNAGELWRSVLARVQFEVNQSNFATWFKDTRIERIDENGHVVVAVKNNFSREWLENKYHDTLLAILRELYPPAKDIEYVISPQQQSSAQQQQHTEGAPQEEGSGQLHIEEAAAARKAGLNPNYRFENFVVGTANELSHAAALGVAEKPGVVYNPLFVYGGTGLGKTHLLQAIGNRIRHNYPKKRIRYITSEKFTSEMVQAIQSGDIEAFKERHRAMDLLIIDDVQFFANKERTQEIFFHLFNILYQQNKQIVLSSDRPPKAISALEDRLRSRFEGGMISDIGFPDLETRIAILRMKAEERGLSFDQEVLNYVASHFQNNVRELEGALNKLAVTNQVNGGATIEEAKKLLGGTGGGSGQAATPNTVIKTVAELYEISQKELTAGSRHQEVVRPRQIAMYILREELGCSYPLIGRKFGGRDHTTAMYAIKKIKKQMTHDQNLNEEITLITQRIYSG